MEALWKYKKKQSEKDGYVETSKADRAIWLMKCLPIVSRLLSPSHPYSDPSRPVAKVVVSNDPLNSNDNDESPPQFTMELAAIEAGHIPKCYAMDVFKEFVHMSVFSHTTQGKISLEEKILNKFDMRSHNQSLELCHERTNKYKVKSREIQVIGNGTRAPMRPMLGMINFLAFESSEKKKTLARGTDKKRTRRDCGEMEAIMFKKFKQQTNWSLKNLIHEIGQRKQFLKDILKDLCVYINKRAKQGT